MKALQFQLRLCSLYSVRIPFTWQSALTYPFLPPSAIIGLIANALQRFDNKEPPLEYLREVEKNVLWAGSRLLSPCVIKSYITSAIVKWEESLGGKFTNALGRQFAYARYLESLVLFKEEAEESLINKEESFINKVIEALRNSPITCGDSESPCVVEKIELKKVFEEKIPKEVETLFPVPFSQDLELKSGKGEVYLVHERCLKEGGNFPLVSYLVPIERKRGIFYPTSLKVLVNKDKVYRIEGLGHLVVRIEEKKKEKRRTKKKP